MSANTNTISGTGNTSETSDPKQASLSSENNIPLKESTQATVDEDARHVPVNRNTMYTSNSAYGRNLNYNYNTTQQDELSTSTLAAAITAGSLLGLTAAAAVRWLNGGDFNLFPPPSCNGDDTEVLVANNHHRLYTTRLAQMREVEAAAEEEASLRELVMTVKSQTDRQEVLMQQLQDVLARENTAKHTKVTDQSMNLLRDETQSMEQLLTSIKGELNTIQKELQDSNLFDKSRSESSSLSSTGFLWENRLSTTLEKLDSTLELIRNDVTSSCHKPERMAATSSIPASTEPNDGMDQPSGTAEKLAAAISMLAMENEMTKMRVGAQLLYLYVVNLASHPRVPRYRKIFTSNDSYQKNVAQLKGSREFLSAVGFVEQEAESAASYWEWIPAGGTGVDNTPTQPVDNNAREELYLQRLKEAAAALSILKTSRPDCEVVDLLRLALVSANIPTLESEENPVITSDFVLPASTTTFTPTRTPSSTNGNESTKTSATTDDAYVFQTPGTGSILSPPTTKKQSCLSLPPADFSSLEQPLLDVGNGPNVVKNQSTHSNTSLREPLKTVNEVDSVEVTSSDSSTDDAAEAVLWK